jgi:hypothetical protein
VTGLDYTDLLATYARQSWCIDHGDAAGWADTFTADGEFVSPSYSRAYQGSDDLREFAQTFHAQARADGVVRRHVVSNVLAPSGEDDGTVTRATLQIIEQPSQAPARVVRVVDIEDRWDTQGDPKIQSRRVSRGDEQ